MAQADALTVIEFEVMIAAVGKKRPRATIIGGKPRLYQPRDHDGRIGAIVMAYKQAAVCVLPHDGPVAIQIVAEYEPPASWPARKRIIASDEHWPKITKPDMDNVEKLVLDALNGIAFVDDRVVYHIESVKRYGPVDRIAVEIERI